MFLFESDGWGCLENDRHFLSENEKRKIGFLVQYIKHPESHTHTHTQPNTGKNCVDSNLRKKMEASERGWDGKSKDIFIRNAGDQKGGK